MAHGYTPGLRITDNTIIRKRRRLPLPGSVLVEAGQAVQAEDIVAATELPGNVVTVNIAHELNIPPEEVSRVVVVNEGDHVQAGDLLAEVKALWGIFHSTARSPVEGTVESISDVTGQVLLRGRPLPVQVKAYISGTVVEVFEDEGVTIECHGALVQGIIGLGRETYGELRCLVDAPTEVLTADLVDDDCAGKILVGGSLVTYDTLQAAVAAGASGIVCGGINDTDIDRFLGYPLGVAITGQEDKPLTLVITEGFGRIPMSDRAFGLLRDHEGQRASMNGATQIRAGVIRPEVIVSHQASVSRQAEPLQEPQLAAGQLIRLIREPYFGLLATIVELPEELQMIETESKVRVLKARLEDGRQVVVPRANVELIEV